MNTGKYVAYFQARPGVRDYVKYISPNNEIDLGSFGEALLLDKSHPLLVSIGEYTEHGSDWYAFSSYEEALILEIFNQ